MAEWVSAGATFAAVLAALGIAWWDRRAAKRDRKDNERAEARRWELDLLLRATILTLQSHTPHDAPPEVGAQGKQRSLELLGLLWALGGPERFPIALRAGEREVDSADDVRRKMADTKQEWWIRREAEVTLAMLDAAGAQRQRVSVPSGKTVKPPRAGATGA